MMDILATPPGNSAPRLLHLSLDLIDIPEGGVRRQVVDGAQEAGLLNSVSQLGIIQPIAVRAHPHDPARRLLVTGRRHLGAARAAGHTTIAVADHGAIEDRDALAIETAENIQRVALAPVDQWRAVQNHLDLGWTIEAAAEALGIGFALARRLAKLGSLHADVLAAIDRHGLPRNQSDLTAIANAPQDAQARALAKHWKGGDYDVPWWLVAGDLREARIPQTRAIFDPEACGLFWQEDIFAEPGSPEQWTTTDAAGFIERQAAELQRQAAASKGKIVVVELDKSGNQKLPAKWSVVWGWKWGEKVPKGATGYVSIRPDGQIVAIAAKPPAKAPAAKAKAADAESDAAGNSSDREQDSQDEQDGEDDAAAPAAPPAKPRWTEKGRIEIGARKTAALQVALRDRVVFSAAEPLRLMLLALAAKNVTVRGAGGGKVDFSDIVSAAHQIGTGDLDRECALGRLAMEALARFLRCDPVVATYGNVSSGPAAEWIGDAVEAEQRLGDFDDAELLSCASGEALRTLAEAAKIPVKATATAKAMRSAITGKLGEVVPTEALFDAAPAPEWIAPDAAWAPSMCGMSAGREACECGWQKSDGDEAEPCDLGLWKLNLARLGLAASNVSFDADGRVQVDTVPQIGARRSSGGRA